MKPAMMQAVRAVAHEGVSTTRGYSKSHPIGYKTAYSRLRAAHRAGYLDIRIELVGNVTHHHYTATAKGKQLVESAIPENMLDVVAAVHHDGMNTTKPYAEDTGLSPSRVRLRYLAAERMGYLRSRFFFRGRSYSKLYRVTPAGLRLLGEA